MNLQYLVFYFYLGFIFAYTKIYIYDTLIQLQPRYNCNYHNIVNNMQLKYLRNELLKNQSVFIDEIHFFIF